MGCCWYVKGWVVLLLRSGHVVLVRGGTGVHGAGKVVNRSLYIQLCTGGCMHIHVLHLKATGLLLVC
jgi:hypothetical protein